MTINAREVRFGSAAATVAMTALMMVPSAQADAYAPPVTIASGLSSPLAVAVDAAGNLFVADTNHNRVVEIPAGGGPKTTIGSGFSSPSGVAVDAAGDVFVADTDHNRVVEVPAGGGPQRTVGSGFYLPMGLAVDAAGNVFVDDAHNGRIVEVPADGAPETTVGTGSFPTAVALDAADDVFIADPTLNAVFKAPVGGGPETMIYGFASVSGVAVDAAGDVFSGGHDGGVTEVPTDGGPVSTIGSPAISGLAIDGEGDLFAVDTDAVLELPLIRATTRSRTEVSCQPPTALQQKQVKKGKSITLPCTAHVRHPEALAGAAKPSGAVGFSIAGSIGGAYFSQPSCPLPAATGVSNTCTVNFTTSTAADYTITATYGGDQTYETSSASTSLSLR